MTTYKEARVELENKITQLVTEKYGVSGCNACPCFGCQCEPNQVTKDAIEEARNRNDPR